MRVAQPWHGILKIHKVTRFNAMKELLSLNQAPSVLIVGAGISGLACAHRLRKLCPELQVRILDSADRPGGVISSLHLDGCLFECGPESFSTIKPEVLELSQDLGILEHVISTRAKNRQSFVSLKQRLQPLPEGFMYFAPSNLLALAGSEIFSLSGKLRMFCELFLPRNESLQDESLSDFVNRRLGREALEKLAEPMIGGIYGGDPASLSAQSTVPHLVSLEHSHGSIIRGLMGSRQKSNAVGASGPRYAALASFDTGISLLVNSLVRNLPEGTLITNKRVTRIRNSQDSNGWLVFCADNSMYKADYLVLSTPAQVAGTLLNDVHSLLSMRLQQIPRSSAIILNLLYDRAAIKHPLNGFGFVVPKTEGRLISACSFSSIKFDCRADNDKVVVRIFTGGQLKAEAMSMTDAELIAHCHHELQSILQIEGRPLMHMVSRHPEAIPQYLLGHSQLLYDIQKDLLLTPGLELIGNSYNGVGLPDCIRSANSAAERISKSLKAGCRS